MLITYFNYPNSIVTVHRDPNCGHIRSHRKEEQRSVSLSLENFSQEIAGFVNKGHKFGSSAAINDMWVKVTSVDLEFELAVVHLVHRMLGKKYKPIRSAKLSICRCAK